MAAKKITAKPLSSFDDLDAAGIGVGYQPFDADAVAPMETPAEPENRTWGQAVGDTVVQLAEGVNTTLGAVPSIVAPDGAMAEFFRDNADYWRDKQSEVLKQRIAATDQRIQEAGKEGVMSQIGTAVSEYWKDPAQAARLVATNLPSMAATLGTGALAGATAKGLAAARGLDAANRAALSAQYGTRTAMATNAALNAGGARGEAYEDLKRTALAQGMSPEQAEQAALDGSILPGVVGGVAGAISGKLGLEKALLGQPGAGAGTALRRSAGAFGAELAGEQIEEVAPKITTNYEAEKIDPARSLTDDLGRTMVETTIGAGPGALVAGGVEGMKTPAQAAADAIRATEKLPESGALTKALNAGVEAKAQAVEAGASVDGQIAPNTAPDPVDDPVRDQILALPDGARQDALRAYAVVNRTDVAKGVQQYNRKLLDRLLTENAPPPVLGESLTGTDMGTMLVGGGMAGNTDPLIGALGMGRDAQANSITNVANVAERRPPMPASDAARMLDEARNRGLDFAVAEHPAGGFVLVPPNWVTPDMAAQGEARLNETIARMQQADAAPVERAQRTSTEPVDLSLPTDPVQNYMDTLRSVNTPAARAYVRDFDAGRITPADVQRRMAAEQGATPDQRIARAAAEAPAQTDPVADRLARAAAQGAAVPAPTDILNPVGLPFKTRMAADRAAKQTPGAVVPVEGGFVVRQQEPVNVQDVPQTPEVPQAAPAVIPPSQAPQAVGAQPAGPAAGVPTEGAGAVEAAGVGGATLYEQRKAKRGSSNQNQAETPVEQAPDAATASRVAKEAQPFENRFVVKDDITGARVEWQALTPAGVWKVQTTFDNIEAATAAVASRGIDPAGVSVWDSAWNASAKRFTPAKKREADRQDAEMQASAATAAPQAEAAPEPAAEQELNRPEAPANQAPEATENVASNSTGQDEKARWLKSVADMQGRALMAAVDEARRAGATNEEIAQAAAGRATAAPQGIAPAPAQETTHNGTRIYPTKTKVGDDVKSMWAVESPDNQRRRAAGERTVGGDSLHDTIEQAKAAAEREAKRDAAQQAAKAEQDAADKARLDAEEARKAANRPKTLMEHRKDAVLSKQVLDSETGNVMTRREWVENKVADGLKTSITQEDKIKPMSRRQIFRADNLQQAEHDRKVKEAGKKDVYWLGDFEVTKIEYDYAQELKAQREAAPQAVESPALQAAMGAAGWTGETGQGDTIWTKRANGERYTALLWPDAGSMEVTVLADGVDTQIASFKVGDAKAAAEAANKAVAQDVAEQSPADDALPNGWTKSVNGYTKRPVYRMEQGGGQPFAVVTQVEGMQYEVQIRHGDKQLIVSNQTGALSEVLAKAETELTRMTQADSVTHQDPGEKAEAATPGVVTDSLKKAARNEDTKPSEMRKWLVGKIDEAIAVAPEAAVDFLSFDVPGDGTFKVQNSQARLQEFRKKVMASPGFKDGGQKQNTKPPEQVDSAINGSGSTVEALRNFLADGDVQGAIEFAKLKGVEFTPVEPRASMTANGKFKRVPASVKSSVPSVAEGLTQVEAEQINQYLTAEKDREEPAAAQDADEQSSPQDFIPAPASASPESEPSQGSSNARGQDASAPPTTPEVKADDVEPKIMQSRPNDWPYANYGWVMVGGGRNAPGAASEKGAKIELSKNPEWKERGAVILPFRWNDGGLRGLSPYAETTTRYAILVRQKESPRIEASSETSTPPAAQPDTPKLPPAEAKALMAWEDLGQKDGVKTHALTFYESQADKDAKRGRMIVAKVSKGDRSATAWMVDGEDKTFGMLAQAKKLAEEVGMARAVADGFVEQGDAPMFSRAPAGGQTETAEFKRWFGDSKVVDAEGKPLVLYHGTHSSFTEFKPNDALGGGMFFSPSPEEAGAFTGATGSNIMPVYLSAQKVWPKIVRSYDEVKAIRAAKSKGYDAIRVRDDQNGVVNWVVFDPTQVKSATGNNGDFDPANADIRFSFAGARAATADRHALVTAQDRLSAGEDAETVRRETGWHRGADGRMRFEISDNEATVDMALLANLHRGGFAERAIEHVSYRQEPDGTYSLTLAPKNPQKTSDFVRMRSIPANLLPSLLPQSALDAIERNEGDEDFIGPNLDDARKVRAPFEFTGFNALPLDAVMDHPKLFAAYPALREIMVRVDPKLGNGATFAVTDYVDGTVGKAIKVGNPLAKDVDSVLLHEIQHGIQDIEGFATGGSIESARAMQADAQSNAFNQAQGAWYESRKRWPSAYKSLMDQRMLDGRLYDKYDIKTMDEDGNQRKAIVLAFELRKKISEADKALRSQAQLAYTDAVESELGGFGSDAFNEFNGLYSAVTKAFEGTAETATSVYKRLAGEVEARNTQARKNISDLGRKLIPPSKTADVADSDVIVVFNGKEMQNAPAPVNAEQSLADAKQRLGAPLDKIRADSNARNVATQMLVDGLKEKWTRAPEIIVARNMQDPQVPQAVRDYDAELKSQGRRIGNSTA
ncbi:MAG: hypothetical protein B7X79_13910 [Acidovorax sp. 17-64-282]|nr:MAG: hypothetical protein B7X79_13910 [Acidovorax sp. 17-64-282]